MVSLCNAVRASNVVGPREFHDSARLKCVKFEEQALGLYMHTSVAAHKCHGLAGALPRIVKVWR